VPTPTRNASTAQVPLRLQQSRVKERRATDARCESKQAASPTIRISANEKVGQTSAGRTPVGRWEGTREMMVPRTPCVVVYSLGGEQINL
jgi:hypothetical protein